ncbi:MAG TPA: biopolymer transporter ExbD [Opitutaceae bacterium]|nr:biopolymer transporter ExbD [Opitutaceae bacterium]HPG18385.1 biopolymer transporter ExbD [Opitutaceae bacterium]HPO00563.1 biopolymer transporter ExbD [Opitutaceae bacterium]
MSGLYEKKRGRAHLNLLPLIDVLVMLIFFSFVTMQFRSAATMNITLPKIETAGKNEFKGTVTIGINKEGVISLNGQATTGEQLRQQLQQVRQLDKDIPVLIKADKTTQLEKLTFIMDSCRKAGLNKFSLQGGEPKQ